MAAKRRLGVIDALVWFRLELARNGALASLSAAPFAIFAVAF